MTTMSINDALEELDSENDAHWTADGDPKLDVISGLVGAKVSRKEVKEAAPHFTRDNPELASILDAGEVKDEDGKEDEKEGRKEEVTANGPEANGGHAGEPSSDPAPFDPLRANPEALEVDSQKPESQQLDEAAQRVQLEIDRLLQERNRLHALASQAHTRESKDKDRNQGTRDRMTYIQRQHELRMARVTERTKVAEALGIEGIGAASSVIDQALRQRKPELGKTRPDHTVMAKERISSKSPQHSPALGRSIRPAN